MNQFKPSLCHVTVNGHSPDSSMGSFSIDLRTWSDSPVRELSSIFRSLPWIRIPSAGSRSPAGTETRSQRIWFSSVLVCEEDHLKPAFCFLLITSSELTSVKIISPLKLQLRQNSKSSPLKRNNAALWRPDCFESAVWGMPFPVRRQHKNPGQE